jgi:hypothetical protein
MEGIVKIQILVNGKEVTEDARPRGSNDQETAVLELEVDLTNNPLMIPGVQNAIEVVAYNGALREISSSGRDAPLVFVETDEFSNAYLLSGRYSVNNDLIEVTVKVFKGEKQIRTFKVEGHKRKLADLASQVAKHMQKIVKKDH